MAGFRIDSIGSLINRLSKKEKTLAYAAVFIILLVFLDRGVLVPIVNKVKALEDEMSHQATKIRDGLVILGYKDRIENEFNALKDYFSVQRKTQEEELADFLKEIENFAVQSNVRLAIVSPLAEKFEQAKVYAKYVVRLECVGTIEDLMKFIYALDAEKQLTKIENCDLSPAGRESLDVKCSMVVSKFIVSI